MTTNNDVYVGWSDRYANYVLIDGNGRLQFSASRASLVFTTREDAYAYARTVN